MSTIMNRFIFASSLCSITLFLSVRATATSFEGFTEPYRKIEVAAAETGVVEKLLVREGDRVVKGQTLATLDTDVLVVSKEIATANTKAKGKLDFAQAERDLRRRLDGSNRFAGKEMPVRKRSTGRGPNWPRPRPTCFRRGNSISWTNWNARRLKP